MNIRFLKIAQHELDAAVEYYNSERKGLGFEFLWEVFASLDRIKEFPDAWQPFHQGTRRCLVQRFAFGIIFKQDNGTIVVFAVAHLHRRPDYWIKRTPSEKY